MVLYPISFWLWIWGYSHSKFVYKTVQWSSTPSATAAWLIGFASPIWSYTGGGEVVFFPPLSLFSWFISFGAWILKDWSLLTDVHIACRRQCHSLGSDRTRGVDSFELFVEHRYAVKQHFHLCSLRPVRDKNGGFTRKKFCFRHLSIWLKDNGHTKEEIPIEGLKWFIGKIFSEGW